MKWRFLYREMKERKAECVWLDCRPVAKRGIDLQTHFPKIFEKCLAAGIDIREDPIPVAPAAHFLCGGIRVDERGRTNLAGLYSVGEASCTGLHGANRLASTSLLEGLVWGKRSADNINGIFKAEDFDDWQIPDWDESATFGIQAPRDWLAHSWEELRGVLWDGAGIVRSEESLSVARRRLATLYIEVDERYRRFKLSDDLVGLRNGLEAGLMIIQQARRNRTNRGCHFREDCL